MSEEYDVVLYVYDLSQGMAKMMSMPLLGKQIDGIWHTGIVCYGYEYYYGGGIQACRPGQSMAGRPGQIIPLGRTRKTQAEFHTFLRSQAGNFTPEKYNLMTNNCNNFSSACARFLFDGFDIPSFILTLPQDALSTPMGQMFRPMLEQMQGAAAAGSGIMPWQERDVGTSLWLPPVGREGIATGAIQYGQHSIYAAQGRPQAQPQPQAQTHAPIAPAATPARPLSPIPASTAASSSSLFSPTRLPLPSLSSLKPAHTLALLKALLRKPSLATSAPLLHAHAANVDAAATALFKLDAAAAWPQDGPLAPTTLADVLSALARACSDSTLPGASMLTLAGLLAAILARADAATIAAAAARAEDGPEAWGHPLATRVCVLLEALARGDTLGMAGASGTAALRKAVLGLCAAMAVRLPLCASACGWRAAEEEKQAENDGWSGAMLQAAVSCAGALSSDCKEDGEVWEAVAACVWAGKAAGLLLAAGAEGTVDSADSLELLSAVTSDGGEAVAEGCGLEGDVAEKWREVATEAVVAACGHLVEHPECDKAWAALGYTVVGDSERSSLAESLGIDGALAKTETAKAVWATLHSSLTL